MTVLVLAGLGPTFKGQDYLAGSLFDVGGRVTGVPVGHPGHGLALDELRIVRDGQGSTALLRTRVEPQLTTVVLVLRAALEAAGIDYEWFDLLRLWAGTGRPESDPTVVLLSTTFIWNRSLLAQAMAWIRQHCPDVPVVCGGQYSNLKYREILADHPEVVAVVRGDGEDSIAPLVRVLEHGGDLTAVPNIVLRAGRDGDFRISPLHYVDIEAIPSPSLSGTYRMMPYESMRGCPFSCKFCSYPAASPTWRYKSATKIADDWRGYARRNGTHRIRALDSTFTVPPRRLRELVELLPTVGVNWEAYSRANSISGPDLVHGLVESGCVRLTIGMESMSDRTLALMHKQVRVRDNTKAHELLGASTIEPRMSFMVGYPGERPEDFAATSAFITGELTGHFNLFVFSFTDETMPVWADAAQAQLKFADRDDPDREWSHIGMDSQTAWSLQRATLDAARTASDTAVLLQWQSKYELPLIPDTSAAANLRAEKAIERLGMICRDTPPGPQREGRLTQVLSTLDELGVARWCAPGRLAPLVAARATAGVGRTGSKHMG